MEFGLRHNDDTGGQREVHGANGLVGLVSNGLTSNHGVSTDRLRQWGSGSVSN